MREQIQPSMIARRKRHTPLIPCIKSVAKHTLFMIFCKKPQKIYRMARDARKIRSSLIGGEALAELTALVKHSLVRRLMRHQALVGIDVRI